MRLLVIVIRSLAVDTYFTYIYPIFHDVNSNRLGVPIAGLQWHKGYQ